MVAEPCANLGKSVGVAEGTQTISVKRMFVMGSVQTQDPILLEIVSKLLHTNRHPHTLTHIACATPSK